MYLLPTMSLDWKYILTYEENTLCYNKDIVVEDMKVLKKDRNWKFRKIFHDTYSFEPHKYIVSNEVLDKLKASQVFVKYDGEDYFLYIPWTHKNI